MAITLDRGCRQLPRIPSAISRQQMLEHLRLLKRWNRRLNLTAIVLPEQMVVQHVLDSIAIANLVKGERLLDIGSGGGFPGMPLAALRPELQVTLLDSRGKRVEFLRHVVTRTAVGNVAVVKSRIQDYRPVEKFDTLMARGVCALEHILDWSKALQSPGSRLIAMKGKLPAAEIAQLSQRWQTRLQVVPIAVPLLAAQRHAVIIDF